MRTGGFALVSGGPAGEVLPVRLAALPNPYYADDAVSGGFLLYADDGSALSSGGWRIYTGREGVSLSSLCLVEWVRPTAATLLAAAAHTVDDVDFNGHVTLFAPAPGATATGAHYGYRPWQPIASPTSGHTDDSWLTESSPGLAAGSYGPHGSLELALAVRDLGFRHLYADATVPASWATSGVFSTEYHFDGIALAEDTFSNQLLLIGASGSELVLALRDADLTWGPSRVIWAAPSRMSLAGVPALWQQELAPSVSGTGIVPTPGDFLIATGLSDGTVQLLRLPYATTASADAAPAAPAVEAWLSPSLEQLAPGQPVPEGQTVQQIAAVSLAQSPPAHPASLPGEFTARPIELYCFYGPGSFNATWFTLQDSVWGPPGIIPSGMIARWRP
jgi:hypothetical protein